MKNKPLINQMLLQKISKPQTFVVRNKTNVCKGIKKDKSSQHLHINDEPTHQELDYFLDVLQKYAEEDRQIEKDDTLRIGKILNLIKDRTSILENSQCFQDFEESSPNALRKSENRYRSKARLDTLEDRENINHERMTIQLIKSKGSKLKLGKENSNKNPVLLEVKIQRLEHKVAENERQVKEYQDKIQELSRQIEKMSTRLEDREKEMGEFVKQKKQLMARASSLVLQNMQNEKVLNQKIWEMQNKLLEEAAARAQLDQRLKEREWEIVSLFQSSNT